MHQVPLMLVSPADILAKARREAVKLEGAVNVDTVFNFFVTAYHVMDYVKASSAASSSAIATFEKDPDFAACKAICNQGKHLKVDRKAKPAAQSVMSGCISGAPIAALPIAGGPTWELHYGPDRIDPVSLAKRVLQKLSDFLVTNSIPIT